MNRIRSRARDPWDLSGLDGWTDNQRTAASELRALLHQAGVTLKSGDAGWTLEETAIVGRVVRNIAQAFGGDAAPIISGVTIKRTRASRWPFGFAGRRCYGWEGLGVVRLNDSAFAAPGRAEHVLTHELGHYFQETRRLLKAFMRATGGHQFNWLGLAQLNLTAYYCKEDPPNQWCQENGVYEDFAGSFEAFVYHQIGRSHPGDVLGARRFEFFQQHQSAETPGSSC